MIKILFLIPSLEYSGAAKQAAVLVRALPRDRFEPRLCALGNHGPITDIIGGAGAEVDALGRTGLFHLPALWRLRRLVRDFRPNVIHAWGWPSLWAAVLAGGRGHGRLVASAPFPPRERQTTPGHLERWFVCHVDQVIVGGAAEAECCRLVGLPPEKIVQVPPGVQVSSREPATWPAALGAARWIICAGPLEPHKGFRDALWAFDILQYLYDDLQFCLVGTGPERERLERFAVATGVAPRVRFAGPQPDLAAFLARAEVVWVPSRASGGIHVALEAMALGRPVVASRLPGLADIIVDGETGLLVPPGDQLELARQTRRLLDNADWRCRMGEAGRLRAATRFSAAAFVQRLADLYQASQLAA
jgi:glycosyltransferase involved in cell wall biosynthesis